MVFYGARNYMLFVFARARFGGRCYRPVVGFAASGCKIDFLFVPACANSTDWRKFRRSKAT